MFPSCIIPTCIFEVYPALLTSSKLYEFILFRKDLKMIVRYKSFSLKKIVKARGSSRGLAFSATATPVMMGSSETNATLMMARIQDQEDC